MEKKIYTITTLQKDSLKPGRCVGYYFGLQEAINAVTNNYQDINEQGFYPYCVIESVDDGIYSLERKEYWFEWKNNKYEKIESKPKIFSMLACFGVG